MKIVSTMGSGHLGCEIDLSTLTDIISGEVVSVSSQSSAMLTIWFEEDGPAHSLYRTGTFQIRGAPDPEALSSEADRLVDFLEEIGVPVSDPSFEHKTSVFLETLDRDVDLETLAIVLGLERVEYEPEQFPGLVFRPDDVAATLLVFSTGKIIIGGTTEESVARQGVDELVSALP